jgi:hypothetical protein
MPNNLESINEVKIDATQLDFILEYKIRKLPQLQSFIYYVYKSRKKQRQELRWFLLPSGVERASKNIVMINPLDITVTNKVGIIDLIIKNTKNYIKQYVSILGIDLHNLEFIIPIRAPEHWILGVLSPSKQTNILMPEISYVLTVIDPACSLKNNEINNSNYIDQICHNFSSAFIQKIKNLSNEQQIFHKEELTWYSAHVLIDNVVRLISGQELIAGKLCTNEYKQSLLDEHVEILKYIDNPVQEIQTSEQTLANIFEKYDVNLDVDKAVNFDMTEFDDIVDDIFLPQILKEIVEKTDEVVAKYSHEIYNNSFSQDPKMMQNSLQEALYVLPSMDIFVRKYVENGINEFTNLPNIKSIVSKFQNNIKLIFTAYMRFNVKVIQNDRCGEDKIIQMFFMLLPKFIQSDNLKKHSLKTIANIKKDFDNFVKCEKVLLADKSKDFKFDVLNQYFIASKNLFLSMNMVFKGIRLINVKLVDFFPSYDGFLAEVEKLSQSMVSFFSNSIEIIEVIQDLDHIFDNVANFKVAKKLIEDEGNVKKKQELRKIEHKEIMQKKDKVISFAIVNHASSENNVLDNKTSDSVDKLIESLKRTILNDGLDLQTQLQKIINIENFSKDNNLTIISRQHLELASVLVLSLLFLSKKISDISQTANLRRKVEQLCDNIDKNDETVKLNASVIKADLYSNLCLILHINCNKAKYNLVNQKHGRLKIACTVENVDKRFALINQYTDYIDKMRACISEINSILTNLPYPANPDGLLFSLAEYTARIKDYELTLQHYEDQNKLAKLQREKFKEAFKNGLIKPLAPGEEVSNASLVQRKIDEQNKEYTEQEQEINNIDDFLTSMQKIYDKCEYAVNDLNVTINSKMSKIDHIAQAESFEYLETLYSWHHVRKRRNSLYDNAKLTVFEDSAKKRSFSI